MAILVVGYYTGTGIIVTPVNERTDRFKRLGHFETDCYWDGTEQHLVKEFLRQFRRRKITLI